MNNDLYDAMRCATILLDREENPRKKITDVINQITRLDHFKRFGGTFSENRELLYLELVDIYTE